MDIHELLRKEEAEPAEEGAPGWYVSFADMATLLMATFLMLLSFASMDLKKFNRMLGSVQTALGAQTTRPGIGAVPSPAAGLLAGIGEAQAPPPAEETLSIVQALFEDLGDGAEVFQGDGGVTVRFEGKVLFEPGSADFKPEAHRILDRVAVLLRKYTFDLHILGHTDSVPIETSRYPSNWELSAARASAALRQLASSGASPQRLVAVGLADSRPIAGNDTPEGRARNRRVEFAFRKPETLPGGGFKPAKLG
jgi:chemotaxis protein MotB